VDAAGDCGDDADRTQRIEHLRVRLTGTLFRSGTVSFGNPEQAGVLALSTFAAGVRWGEFLVCHTYSVSRERYVVNILFQT
jgi:hypothetical protein